MFHYNGKVLKLKKKLLYGAKSSFGLGWYNQLKELLIGTHVGECTT